LLHYAVPTSHFRLIIVAAAQCVWGHVATRM
jgi:hypothetical protein